MNNVDTTTSEYVESLQKLFVSVGKLADCDMTSLFGSKIRRYIMSMVIGWKSSSELFKLSHAIADVLDHYRAVLDAEEAAVNAKRNE